MSHHWKETIANESMDRKSRVRAFFLLVKPEYR
jgi:hypothetical protein